MPQLDFFLFFDEAITSFFFFQYFYLINQLFLIPFFFKWKVHSFLLNRKYMTISEYRQYWNQYQQKFLAFSALSRNPINNVNLIKFNVVAHNI